MALPMSIPSQCFGQPGAERTTEGEKIGMGKEGDRVPRGYRYTGLRQAPPQPSQSW